MPAPGAVDPWDMLLPPPRPRDVLIVARDAESVSGCVERLHEEGHVVDVVRDRAQALDAFFQAGGHRLVLLAPDLGADEAETIWNELRAIHDDLLIL